MTVMHRLMPPPQTGRQTMTVNGRSYTCQVGNVIDVLNFDAGVLEANGWTFIAQSGPTSARPTPSRSSIGPEGSQAGAGAKFYDTTLGALIVCDGATWRSPVDGSEV